MMIRTVLFAGAFLAIFAGGAPAADFAPPPNRVYAFFSSQPTLEANVKPTPGEAGIAVNLPLRPNVEQSAYVYVYNPKDDETTVTVALSAGVKAGGEIARTAAPILVPSKTVMKVALVGRAAPAAPAKDVKDAKEPPPAGVKIEDRSSLYLIVEEKGDKPGRIIDPKGYEAFEVEVPRPDRDSKFSVDLSVPRDGELAVKVKFVKQKESPLFTDLPAKVRLDLRPDFNEKLDPATVNQGTFEAEVPAGGEATLVAQGVRFKDGANEEAVVLVSVDGYDRTFRIKTDFKGLPTLQTAPFLNVKLSSAAQVPGKPVTVTVESDDDANDTVLAVDRIGDRADKSFETIRNFLKQPRQKAIYVGVGGEGDAVKFVPVVKDWSVDFSTANVSGVRTFEVRNGTAKMRRQLLVDRTPPAKLKLELPAKDKLIVGTEQVLKATGEDLESGTPSVFFYLGEAPSTDGKAAPGSKVVKGEKQADGSYATKDPIRLPENRGDVKLGVLVVNGVGLSSTAEANAYAREPEKTKEEKAKEKKTTGDIEGVVMQSIRPQPDLPVILKDAAGKELKKATTDSSGKFAFKDLAPGEYIVSSVKRADQNSNGSKEVTVEAGDKPAKVEIAIKR